MKKMILLIIIISVLFTTFLYVNKSIGYKPLKDIKLSNERREYIIDKDIKIETFSFVDNDYNLNELSDFLLSYKGISLIKIYKDETYIHLDFGYNKGISSEKIIEQEKLIGTIIEIYNKEKLKDNIIVIPNYTSDLIKEILLGNFNFKLNNGKDLFPIVEQSGFLEIQESNLNKYFNKETINSFKLGNDYITDNITPYAYGDYYGYSYPKQTLYSLKFKDKFFQEGFVINEKTYPVLYAVKNIGQGNGLKIQELNNKKKNEIEFLYNNFDIEKNSSDFLYKNSDNKESVKLTQNIYDFTTYDKDLFTEIFLNNFEIIKQDGNKMLVKNQYGYIFLYFDIEKKYKYEKDKLKIKGDVYKFKVNNYIKTEPVITKNLLNDLNNEIINKGLGIDIIKGKEYNTLGNIININNEK